MLTKEEIAEVYDSNYKKLFHSCLRITGDSMEAEEVVHDVMLKLWQFEKELTYEQRGAWLYKSCIRASIDRIRKKIRREMLIERRVEDGMIWIDDHMDKRNRESELLNMVENVKRGLEQLPQGYQVVLSLHLFEGYDYEEIAGLLKVGESTVRSQYLRGKKKLSEIVKNEYYG